jgi:hypothetical protein
VVSELKAEDRISSVYVLGRVTTGALESLLLLQEPMIRVLRIASADNVVFIIGIFNIKGCKIVINTFNYKGICFKIISQIPGYLLRT